MAEALVSSLLEQLASILIQQVESEVKLVNGVEEEVQKLTSNYRAIKAVIEDAEKRKLKENAVRDWLDKLQDTSYDIHDVLDQWRTAIQKLHMNKIENASILKKKVRSLIPTYRFSPKQLVLRREIVAQIRNLNKTLDFISREKDMFSFNLMSGPREVERQMTTSVIDLSQVHGRRQDKTELVNLLLSESSEGVLSLPIVSIIGMGGIGKTTLAHLAYHDDRVNAHFEKKMWVCVSDPFDEIRIARAILESLQGVAPNVAELETLLQHISQTIDGMKFLLVLDDVWTEDPNKWEQLKDSLKCAAQGSKILLTTRKENVARMMRTSNVIPVGKLSEEESWSLFSQVAFCGGITKEYNDLEGIGRKIVNKCNGLPLAVKTIGSLMSLKAGFEQWQSVLNSELWKLEEIEKGLFPPLLLSYYDLSSNLRKCFSYCAIFPKDYKIKKDLLIKLWMAQGYLKLEGREDMELIGEESFENLAMRSFFQDFETDYEDGSVRSCKMHDIVHDFAQFLMKNESFTIEVVDLAASQLDFAYVKARHSMMILKSYGSFPMSICNEAKLHTLVIECYDHYLTSDILSKVFDKLRCLRTLDLDIIDILGVFNPIDRIPKGIEKLIRLRHLGLKKFLFLKALPDALCDLYNLQTLDVSYCSSLRKLPQRMGKLINLRHLIIEGITLSYMPKGMERLTGLRSLRNFFVGNGNHGDKACTLGCLKNLNNLRGSLALHGLGNVTNVDDVWKANLKSKKNLLHLRLTFDKEEVRGRINAENEVVLEALHPPPNLEKLTIWAYGSNSTSTSVHWMVLLTKLRILELHYCENWVNLHSFGKLPSLESLVISNMKNLRRLDKEILGIESSESRLSSSSAVVAFPKLKCLKFQSMEEWEEWDFDFLVAEDITIMPCLVSLELYSCYKLKELPDYLLQKTTLEQLVLYECTELEERFQEGIGVDCHKISHIPQVRIVMTYFSDYDERKAWSYDYSELSELSELY